MCLLELEKSPKPIASCAVSALNTMQLYTETVVVQKAREGIIEFLLINHPLDCPICDWGGECDLQDIVMVFGGDRGRFYEKKRSVLDKNCGPLIKTVMTRCIHCTRCIRFYNNIAGFPFLGTTGRGGKMEIGNYFFKSLLDSELSGNLVDLCPVGALTSKPLAFSSRPWEYQEIISVDISDSLGASIRIDFIGNKIYRIVPVINEFTNEEWIHDKARFSFDGIYLQRLTDFYIYNLVTNKSIYLDKAILINWLFFIFILVHKNLLYLNIFLGSSMDILDILYVKNIIYFSQNKQNFLNYQKKLYLPPLNFRLNNNSFLALKLSKKIIEVCLIIGLNLRVENAILNLKLRNYFLSNKTFVCSIGSHISSNFKIHELSNNLVDLFYILEGKQDFNSFLLNSKYSLLLLGFSVFFTKTGFLLWSLLNKLKIFLFSISKELEIFYISPNVTISNCLEVGLIFNNIKNKKSDKNLYILYNCDELYNIKRNKNDFFLFINHHGDSLSLKSDLIISIPTNFERNFYFINLYGIFQKTSVIFKLFNYYDFFSNHLILCKNMINNENLLLFTDSHAVEFYDLKVILISFYFYILNLGYTKIRNFFNLINDSLTTNLSLIIFSNLSYEILFPFFKTFYMTDDITKNSKIMTECIKLLINIEDNFFKMKI